MICDAVNYAHLHGVIHRDLKPGNIIVQEAQQTQSGSIQAIPCVKILDFGLARLIDPDQPGTSMLTEAGVIMGTLQYMSPEQTRGNPAYIDFRADVYALGIILYELIFNRRPYDLSKAAVGEAIRIICEQPPKRWDKSWTDVRKPELDLWTVLEKALEKDPERRYSNASALGEDVQRYLTSQPVVARPASHVYRMKLFVRRYWLGVTFGVTFAASLFLLISTFGIVMTVQARKIAQEAEIARNTAEVMMDSFKIWDPVTARGKTFGAKEVLDRAAQSLASGSVRSPRVLAVNRQNY